MTLHYHVVRDDRVVHTADDADAAYQVALGYARRAVPGRVRVALSRLDAIDYEAARLLEPRPARTATLDELVAQARRWTEPVDVGQVARSDAEVARVRDAMARHGVDLAHPQVIRALLVCFQVVTERVADEVDELELPDGAPLPVSAKVVRAAVGYHASHNTLHGLARAVLARLDH